MLLTENVMYVDTNMSESEIDIDEIFATNLMTYSYLVIGILTLSTIIIVAVIIFRKCRKKVEEVMPQIKQISLSHKKPRFRKRDKVWFYGQKMLRKVNSSLSRTDMSGRRIKKRQMVLKFAKRLLRVPKKESKVMLQQKEPPPEYLEEDLLEDRELELPPEVLYMLKSVRVLGHFEKPLFLELCRHMTSVFVPTDEYLFRIGEVDDSVYVVQTGKILLYVSAPEGAGDVVVKEVLPGDNIVSLLSILDVITGHAATYKTVSAKAAEDATILRLPVHALSDTLERYPGSLVRVVQMIMVRLQRVTFLALHNYLGLSAELINPIPAKSFWCSRYLENFLSSPSKPPVRSNLDEHHRQESVEASISTNSSADEKPSKSESINIPGPNIQTKASLSGKAFTVTKNDFDAACQRARAYSLDRDKDIRSRTALKSKESVTSSKQFKHISFSVPSDQSPCDEDLSDDPLNSAAATSKRSQESYMMQLAKEDLVRILDLKDDTALEGRMVLRQVSAGKILVRQAEADSSIFFVVTGALQVMQRIIDKEHTENLLFVANPGEIVGTLSVLTGEPSMFTIRARQLSHLIVITKSNFYDIMRDSPKVVLHVAHGIAQRLSQFVRSIDFALDWTQIEAGRAVFRQGDLADSIYIVLSGRLRSVLTRADKKRELCEEHGRGELVGVVEVLTQTVRTTTVMAVRDTEVAKLPEGLLSLIKRKYPQVVARLMRLLGERVLISQQRPPAELSLDAKASLGNLSTIAVMPVTDDVPLDTFTLELTHALEAIGPTMRLTSSFIKETLGPGALDQINDYRLSSWLAQQDDMHRIVLYMCDYKLTPWTRRCIRHADCVLIVALANQEPSVGKIESQLSQTAMRAQKELVLLHHSDAQSPSRTAEWLNMRDWCTSHHHIRCPKRMFLKRSPARMEEMYDRVFASPPDRFSDFSRLARFLTGTSIGLILGGGGARGASHVGLIKAMLEYGIPIDMVGGTSIGAIMGALWCEERNITRFTQRAREWAKGMTSLWTKVLDLTYPITAMFSVSIFLVFVLLMIAVVFTVVGKFHQKINCSKFFKSKMNSVEVRVPLRKNKLNSRSSSQSDFGKVLVISWQCCAAFNRSIETVFQDKQIEDLWLPYFCITTDITSSTMRVHTSGSVWRYVRASMSLSGYLPPLCDPQDGHLLLDGGYVNNLPADVIRQMGAYRVVAIDVGSQDESDLTNYGDELSGWWLLWKRWNPWVTPVRVPDMTEIQSRLAYVSCVRQLEQVKKNDFVMYIRPPIDKYKTLQFGSFDEIHDVGYNHGKTLFEQYAKTGTLGLFFLAKGTYYGDTDVQKKKKEASMLSLRSYVDLAALVSQIDIPSNVVHMSSASDDEYSDDDALDENIFDLIMESDISNELPQENSRFELCHRSSQKEELNEPSSTAFQIGQ